jgi:hypothetical protein
MPNYHLVRLKRDGKWAWTLGTSDPSDKSIPLTMYETFEEAESEKVKLNALEKKPKS